MATSTEEPGKDDRRGTPAGQGTVTPPHGGRIGNPPFVPTDEMRERVKALAKTFPENSNHYIAVMLGIHRETLTKHFRHELDMGRAEMIAAIGAQVINRAMNADALGPDNKPLAKGDFDAQRFVLAKLVWSNKVEVTGKDGGPIETLDLSGLTPAALREYGRQAAIARGEDPDLTVGPALSDD